MEFSVRIDAALGVVVVAASGAMSRIGTGQMVASARAAGAAHGGLPILYDLREASPGQIAKSDIFWMARTSPGLGNGHSHVRIATLFPAAFGATARFWEDSFRNAGLDARAFEREEDAIAWLRGA